MQVFPITRAGLSGLAILFLVGCDDAAVGQKGFEAKYAVARTALEEGNYEVAKRHYLKLVPQAGPLAQRLQLEYAHAALRSNDFGKAAAVTSSLANTQTGEARSAALAVYGTAKHEMGMIALGQGDTASGKAHLTAARGALAEVVKKHPDMDPIGSLAGRLASIKAQLKAL